MNELLAITILMFLAGLFFTLKYKSSDLKETFDTIEKSQDKETKARCPNILVKDGNRFHLKNTQLAEIPGVNPITFDSLDEYTEFIKWQRSQGITCPILHLEKEYGTQGKATYRMRANGPDEPTRALPIDTPDEIPTGEVMGEEIGRPYSYDAVTKLTDANRNDPPYNNNSYPGFDPMGQHIGDYTPLDKMFNDSAPLSPNAMDPNWGGVAYTQNVVDKYYHGHHHV